MGDFFNYLGQQLFFAPAGGVEWWAAAIRALLRVVIALVMLLAVPVPILILWERRFLGFLQGRLGPNRVGFQGLLQPIADVTKLLFKEDITPYNVDKLLYFIAPAVSLAPVIMAMTVLPWNSSPQWGSVAPGLNVGILFLLGIASIEVYGTILAGWSSNNKYSLLGGLRGSSQVISYELGMGLAIVSVLLICGTLDMQGLVLSQGQFWKTPALLSHEWYSGFWNWNVLSFFPFGFIACGIYMISMIAETNRAPFDLPEAETELVAGFHTEYTSMKFAMFFMGEYTNMVIVSVIAITLFFGGWLAPLGFLSQIPPQWGFPEWLANLANYCAIPIFWFLSKLAVLLSLFIWVRASFPRLRYDMLMRFGWKGLLPVAIVNLALIAFSLALQSSLPFENGWLKLIAAQIIAVGAGAVLLGIMFMVKRTEFYSNRRAAQSSDSLPAPIIRDTTAVVTPAAAVPEM